MEGMSESSRQGCGELLIPNFFNMMHHIVEEEHAPKSKEVKRSIETFVVHFTKARKSAKLYLGILFRNYRVGNPTGAKAILDARRWKTKT